MPFIDDRLQQLLTANIDLQGRRIINAGNAKGFQDYVTKMDIRNPEFEAIRYIDGTVLITFTNSSVVLLFDLTVPDEVYGNSWDGSLEVPTKNAVYDKFESLITGNTFTPTISFGGGVTGIVYSLQNGEYQKVGDWNTIRCYVRISNKGSSTGALTLDNLPVALDNTLDHYAVPTLWVNHTTGVTGFIQGFITPGSTSINIQQSNTGVASALLDTNCNNDLDIIVCTTYKG